MRSVMLGWAVASTILLSACTPRMERIFDDPELTPVGSGSTPELSTGSLQETYADYAADKADWRGGPADFFTDARARRPGDLVTVVININDRASFSNSSNRSRKSKTEIDADVNMGLWMFDAQGKGEANAGGSSSSNGQGSVTRSEKLSISVAAVVRQVMPNGHLLVEGSQEVLVNSELRKLQMRGIVDPRDIQPDNSIDYMRVAEARVLYGGSGRVSDVQRPRWGMQLWDKISPF